MAGPDFSTGKSIVVLAIVVGCFAILWPKIFYPMMQAAFSMTAPNIEGEDRSYRPRDRPPHLSPEMMTPHLHEGGQVDKEYVKEGRPFPHPSSRQPAKPQAKTGGAMSIIMPVYTIGIVVFFLYTVLKLVFKKSPDTDKKPLIKDFHMDPEYHKFVCQQTPKEKTKSSPKSKPKPTISEPVEEKTNEGQEDYEIYKLRKKLEETESAMERIMKHMGAVSECLSNACLLKDCAGGNGNKNIALETLLPESLTEAFRNINNSPKKNGKNKGKSKKQDDKENDSDGEKITDIFDPDNNIPTQDIISEDSSKGCCNLECPQDKELKRDSSINSETSSFELLSQSLISNSGELADTNSSDSDVEQPKKCEPKNESAKNDVEDTDHDHDDNDNEQEEEEDEDEEESEDSGEHEFSGDEQLKKSHPK